MRKLVLLLVLLISFYGKLVCQSCLPDGIIFSNQAQIDSFKLNYPDCSEIEGSVLISGDDITNLSGLNELSSIGGGLIISDNDILTNLLGFDNLYRAGYLEVEDNPSLISLEGLAYLYLIDDFFLVRNNPSLKSLSGPGNLNSIGGYLSIDSNQVLTSIYALINVESIGSGSNNGDIFIHHNPGLLNLTGLDNISPGSIANLHIYSNPLLSNCDLASICGYLASPGGIVEIHDNNGGCNNPAEVTDDCADNCLPGGIQIFSQEELDSLQLKYPDCHEIMGRIFIENSFDEDITSLSALGALTSIGGYLHIAHCPLLTSLTGLDSVTYIGGSLYIEGNDALTDMNGVENLNTLWNDLHIDGNTSMGSLSGLENLKYIGDHLIIEYSPALNNLLPLINVKTIGNGLVILDNDSLTSLSGLDNIDGSSISELYISDNGLLSECDVQSVCDYLSKPGGKITITDNAAGCNSYVEVAIACGYTEVDSESGDISFSIHPNPCSAHITIDLSVTPQWNTSLSIYNIDGQPLINRRINERQTVLDVSGLSRGVYFVKVISDDGVTVGKFVKQ